MTIRSSRLLRMHFFGPVILVLVPSRNSCDWLPFGPVDIFLRRVIIKRYENVYGFGPSVELRAGADLSNDWRFRPGEHATHWCRPGECNGWSLYESLHRDDRWYSDNHYLR